MFTEHGRAIQDWSRKSPDNLARVIQLAIVSAHAPFVNIVADMAIAASNKRDQVLFAWKGRAYDEAWRDREAVAWQCSDILYHADSAQDASDGLLHLIAGLHGMGFAKAGFTVQMAFGLSGCLDVHNLKRYGISPYVARGRLGERPVTLATIRKRVRIYNATCERFGGAAALWDTWCGHMATLKPQSFDSAYHVSSLHCEALGIT